jgi:D-alanyl-D-alanine carboxypeptidase
VSTSNAGLNGGYYVRSFVIADLAQMAAAARDAGAAIGVASAYRSYSTQVATFNSWVSETGYEDALLVSARPGHSEHQLGTTLDLKTAGGPDPWEVNFASTAAGSWLRDNAWRYGFVMSYPYGPSPSVTCYAYEPWHYRYFGRALAAAIHDSAQTSREYLWDHGSAMETPTSSGTVATPRPVRTSTRGGGDRPAKNVVQPPVASVIEPEPSSDATPEIQLPEESPDLYWTTWEWPDFVHPVLTDEPQPADSRAPPGDSRNRGTDGATGAESPEGGSILAGLVGVIAGLVVLAVAARSRRRRAT